MHFWVDLIIVMEQLNGMGRNKLYILSQKMMDIRMVMSCI